MAPTPLLRALVALVGVVGLVGCDCLFDPTLPQCTERQDGGPAPEECEDGRCAVTSPGCDGADVERVRDQTCATCAGPDGDVLICGTPTTAECELRYDANGEECRYCPTDTGEVLYDDCFGSAGAEGDLSCEAAPVGPDDPVAPDMTCQVCRDAYGNVVENRCEPVSDECHEEAQGDTLCRICTSAGQVVVQECLDSGGNLAPDFCEAYENAAGRCVDCWSEDILVSHRCSSATAPVTCIESVTVDQLLCLTCVDANGVVVEQSCSPDVPEPQQCQLLEYSEQTCVVCLGADGVLTSTSCERTNCANGECAPPPPCSFEYDPSGQLCRTCPTDAGDLETRCLGESALVCEEILDPTQRCTACYDVDTGLEVYRDCGGAPPPSCEVVQDGTGGACEVCYDPGTGQRIYSSCDGQTCSYLGGFSLAGVNGTPLTVENRPAVADCGQCASQPGTNDGTALSCTLLHDCDDGSQTFVDTVCPTSVVFDVAPLACGNPWQEAGFQAAPGSLDEVLAVLSYALEGHQLALVSVDQLASPDGATCSGCDCQRTDQLRLEVRAEDAARVVMAFEPVLDRCGSDTDCGGGLCRMDGACSPP